MPEGAGTVGGNGGGGVGHGTVGPGAARFAGNAAGGLGGLRDRDRVVEQSFIRKGWVGEVPLENASEDLW